MIIRISKHSKVTISFTQYYLALKNIQVNIFEQEIEQIREQAKIREINLEEEIGILKEQVNTEKIIFSNISFNVPGQNMKFIKYQNLEIITRHFWKLDHKVREIEVYYKHMLEPILSNFFYSLMHIYFVFLLLSFSITLKIQLFSFVTNTLAQQ